MLKLKDFFNLLFIIIQYYSNERLTLFNIYYTMFLSCILYNVLILLRHLNKSRSLWKIANAHSLIYLHQLPNTEGSTVYP